MSKSNSITKHMQGNKKGIYAVHMNHFQVQLIHKALCFYMHVEGENYQNLDAQTFDELQALIDMSDFENDELKPLRLPLINGWCL